MRLSYLHLCYIVLFLFSFQLQGNAQSSYKYLNGTSLIDSLHQFIQPIRVLGYGGGAGRTWEGFYNTDRLSNGQVLDRYSNQVRYFNDNYSAVSGMNIEHIWANSWWGHIQNFAYKDLFNLYPSDATANQRKSNNPIGVVDGLISYQNDVIKVGEGINPGTGSKTIVWEPADDWKGDFARTYFYMAIAYCHFGKDSLNLWTTTEGLSTVDPESPLVMREGVYRLMLDWAKSDPVDQIERDRCDSIEWIQGNRNPFVDIPTLCEYIWGDSTFYEFDFHRVIAFKNPDVHIEPDPDPATTAKFSVSPQSLVFTATPGYPSGNIIASVFMQNIDPACCVAQAEYPYQLSLDGEQWSQEITTTYATQGFYIRFAGADLPGDYEGEIVCNANGVDSKVLTAVCRVSTISFWENFESGSKGSYALADVKCQAATWAMCNAMIAGDAEKDHPRDSKCVRMKGYVKTGTEISTPAYIMMTTDKEDGCDSLWFYAGSYGTDTGVKMTVSYSIDEGINWIPIVKELSVGAMRRYSYKLNQRGSIRLMFQNDNTGNKRVNIDDVQMSDWVDADLIKDVFPSYDNDREYNLDGTISIPSQRRNRIVVRKGKKHLFQ